MSRQTGLSCNEPQDEESAIAPVVPENDPLDLDTRIDRSELWFWYVARIRKLGDFSSDQARLKALLNWSEKRIEEAASLAMKWAEGLQFTGESKKSYLEYRTADILAHRTLEKPLQRE